MIKSRVHTNLTWAQTRPTSSLIESHLQTLSCLRITLFLFDIPASHITHPFIQLIPYAHLTQLNFIFIYTYLGRTHLILSPLLNSTHVGLYKLDLGRTQLTLSIMPFIILSCHAVSDLPTHLIRLTRPFNSTKPYFHTHLPRPNSTHVEFVD